jgi:hypothetical protein
MEHAFFLGHPDDYSIFGKFTPLVTPCSYQLTIRLMGRGCATASRKAGATALIIIIINAVSRR